MKACIILVALLLAVVSPCLASTDYKIGWESRLDESLIYTSAYGIESASGVASSGSMYFVTWMGLRDWLGGDIFGARVSEDGTVLDPGGIKFDTSYTGRPAVCWNGSSFFVAYGAGTLRGQRVMPDGTRLDNPSILINSGSANPIAVSWDGTNHVVVWEDRSVGSSDLFMARVSATGALLDPTKRAVSTRTTAETYPQVASSPSGMTLIVWQDARNESMYNAETDIYGVIVDSAGVRFPSADGIPICTLAGADNNPSVCWSGDHFKVAWAHAATASGTPNTIMDIRVRPDGTMIDPAPIIVSTGTENRITPRIAHNGSLAFITWTQSTSSDSSTKDVWGALVDNCGVSISGNGFPICQLAGSQSNMLLSSAGTEFLAVYNDSSLGGIFSKLCADRISDAGAVIPSTIDIATAPPYQEFPSVAFSGQEYLACWMELKDGKRCVYGAFVDEYLEKPKPDPSFCIDPDVTLSKWNDPSWVHVVWNGQDYVVTWFDGSYNRAMRIRRDGTFLDPAGITVGDNSGVQMIGYPGLATDGNRCLIVHQIGRYLRAVLMARDGSILADRQIEDLGSSTFSSGARAYWTGRVYVLVKHNNLIQILDRDANPISAYTAPAGPGGNISLAVGRTNCLLVWSEGAVVKSMRLALDGTLIDAASTTLATSSSNPAMPSVSWDGKHYLIFIYDYNFELVRVTEENTVVDASPLDFTSSHEVGWWAVPCAGPKGKTLVAYCDWEPAPRNAMRIKGQFFYSYLDLSNLGEAFALEDGTYVSLIRRIATASFPGAFYSQEAQSRGIRVGVGDVGIAVGDSVYVEGVMGSCQGERMISATEAAVTSQGHPLSRPLGMTLRDLGGAPPNPSFEPIEGATGAYNVCLLVRVWGRVTYSATEYFYIDDGSNLIDGSGHIGVKVLKPLGYPPPEEEDLVSVTGISGAEELGGRIIRVIRAKDFLKL